MTTRATDETSSGIRLGLRANLAQFSLLVVVNALVGGMLGQERTVLPLLADDVFHLSAYTSALTYILAFGATKAVTNFFAGTWSDRFGRKPVLIAGWLIALPIPAMLAWGPTWGWIIAANILLGINQGLTWSTTVIMKIDLVGPERRGLAMGFNEAAGYVAVAATAMATGAIADHAGLRPEPFLLGAAYVVLALGLSTLAVRETRDHARFEAARHVTPVGSEHDGELTTGQITRLTSLSDKALSAASQAGMVNNLNDALAWGIFPLLFAAHGLSIARIGILAALYPAVWGAGQMLTGWWSDHIGRKHLITAGMLLQAAAIALVAAGTTFGVWATAQVLLGVGTALVYPTLLAVIGDVAHPAWRARAVGVYRLWRDGGFAVGALLAGVLADAFSLTTAIWAIAALTAASGLVVAVRMYETHPRT
ncbi:MFS transporter [Streptomyces lunaelactis]|uniref:MFS transporter n=1 Tax=Streptomyces lunaelactis TaxID=1535768 RepID=UPI0015850260|nr:MFS transporter [Streptomyces lunaelactis]NUK07360.1 MFS transporter [Streptomyces lunaelactis]NUK15741.1 MFS transporter [Streptomyces lunaelactis]NUK22294.1 MFS transporter [Streptomyces lunaelactis]NUK44390.1 MFS transporter [Streptomyces lunaelactis]NUK49135.1 MFS transporter [Streptomyces lunaelactis]